MKLARIALVILLTAMTATLLAQTDAPSFKGMFERIKVHEKSLEGNLSGDSADRDVSIYLPPGYAKEMNKRYPVVYLLHGFTDFDDRWFGPAKHFINVPLAAAIPRTAKRKSGYGYTCGIARATHG